MTEPAKRQTRQKQEVRAALAGRGDFTSAQDLYLAMKSGGSGIGLATVYRNLNEMVRNEEADSLHADSGQQLFRSCGDGHHHHLICTSCGRTVEIEAPLESWVDRVADEHGFRSVRHVVDLFGVCAECDAASR